MDFTTSEIKGIQKEYFTNSDGKKDYRMVPCEDCPTPVSYTHLMPEILKELTKYPVATRLSLNGTIIVGRDIAHAKLKERLDRGEDLP